jgi:hypothetical protein
MVGFLRMDSKYSRIADEVYEVIRCHGSVLQGDGTLTRETKCTPSEIGVALELLLEEGKITRTIWPKGQEVFKSI